MNSTTQEDRRIARLDRAGRFDAQRTFTSSLSQVGVDEEQAIDAILTLHATMTARGKAPAEYLAAMLDEADKFRRWARGLDPVTDEIEVA